MKLAKIFFVFLVALFVISCSSDDDICTSGEATPRIKLKFRTQDGKEKTLDTLYLSVDYESGNSLVIKQASVDSVLVALRVDNQQYTDFYIKQRKNGPESKIRVNYSTSSEYVSPACGIKRLYHNLNAELLEADPVTNVEKNQNQIINEDKTHLYLIF